MWRLTFRANRPTVSHFLSGWVEPGLVGFEEKEGVADTPGVHHGTNSIAMALAKPPAEPQSELGNFRKLRVISWFNTGFATLASTHRVSIAICIRWGKAVYCLHPSRDFCISHVFATCWKASCHAKLPHLLSLVTSCCLQALPKGITTKSQRRRP